MKSAQFCAVALSGLLLAACSGTVPSTSADSTGSGSSTTPAITGPRDGGGLANKAGPGSAADFQTNVGDRVLFATDSHSLTTEARALLDKQAAWLSRYGQWRLAIEGHCDERGTREYNLALGDRRANTVKEYLASRGIAATRLRTVSYGKERPVEPSSDDTAWSQNRRTVSVIEG